MNTSLLMRIRRRASSQPVDPATYRAIGRDDGWSARRRRRCSTGPCASCAQPGQGRFGRKHRRRSPAASLLPIRAARNRGRRCSRRTARLQRTSGDSRRARAGTALRSRRHRSGAGPSRVASGRWCSVRAGRPRSGSGGRDARARTPWPAGHRGEQRVHGLGPAKWGRAPCLRADTPGKPRTVIARRAGRQVPRRRLPCPA